MEQTPSTTDNYEIAADGESEIRLIKTSDQQASIEFRAESKPAQALKIDRDVHPGQVAGRAHDLMNDTRDTVEEVFDILGKEFCSEGHS